MRDGFRIVDTDTHVEPGAEVLLRYADKALLDRVDELKPYVVNPGPDGMPAEGSLLRYKPIRYNRVAGQKAVVQTQITAAGSTFLEGRTPSRNPRPFAHRANHDNAAGRLQDMDTEGADVHFIIPGTWSFGSAALPADLTHALHRAYHRYMADFCSADTRRLKAPVLAMATDPEEAARAIRQHGKEPWAAAAWPILPEGMPVDDPDLEPIWAAAAEGDLPIMYHGFTVETPYFPGYRDIWDNAAVGRCAGQTWGGARFLAFILISGVFDRYPSLRAGVLECGHGWLPHWLVRLTRQIDYVRGSTPELKHTPLEYAQMGRVFCGIDYSEGLSMTKAVTDILGDGVLMYQSDYPHPESMFPETPDQVLPWGEALGAGAMQKLMWENATRFFRLEPTPWA